ncbi:MAG: methyltransferase domain-containing protein [Candidatus Pacebacteria bacterium]|nr:methyltransferase domain-containing protein [Candidatus Paceibacterota bacterium]
MRTESFDTLNTGVLDKVIWAMRTAQVRRHLPTQVETMVDLGCGHRAPLLHKLLTCGMAQRGIGVDLAPTPTPPHPAIELIQGDLNEPIDIPDIHVDVVFSLAVIEHLTKPAIHAREAYRILKPGGVLLLTTPSPRGKPLLEFLAYRLGVIDRREIDDHKYYFNSIELQNLLEYSGFTRSTINARTFQLGMNNLVVAVK